MIVLNHVRFRGKADANLIHRKDLGPIKFALWPLWSDERWPCAQEIDRKCFRFRGVFF